MKNKSYIFVIIMLIMFLVIVIAPLSASDMIIYNIGLISVFTLIIATILYAMIENTYKGKRKMKTRHEIHIQLTLAIASIMAAIFMFGAFYSSYLTYGLTFKKMQPQLVWTEYNCPEITNWYTGEVRNSDVSLSNFGEIKSYYRFGAEGNNMLFSDDYNKQFNLTFSAPSYTIDGDATRSQRIYYKIENVTKSEANYTIFWYGYELGIILHNATCCFEKENSGFWFKSVEC
jgi:hypothetical protein